MKLLFLNGERGLFAVRPYDVICFPTKGSKINKPGLYECTVVTEKEKFAFVDGDLIPTVRCVRTFNHITENIVRNKKISLQQSDFFDGNKKIGKKIGESYVYFESGVVSYYQLIDGNYEETILFPEVNKRIMMNDLNCIPKKNYRITLNDAFHDDSYYKYEDIEESVENIWNSIKDSVIPMNKTNDMLMAFAVTVIGNISHSDKLRIENLKIVIHNGIIAELSYDLQPDYRGLGKAHRSLYYMLIKSDKLNVVGLYNINYMELINYIFSNVVSKDKNLTIVTYDNIKEWMQSNMVSSDGYGLCFDTNHHMMDFASNIMHVDNQCDITSLTKLATVNAFNESMHFHTINSCLLFYALVDIEYMYPEAKDNFLKELKSTIETYKTELDSKKKLFGKNVTRRNLLELRKLSYVNILGI